MSSAKFTTVADTTNDGYLSTTDWDTFNDKSDIDGVPGATISSNFFYIDSGNTLYSWYTASSSKLSASGALAHNKVTLAGETYLTLSDQEITATKLDLAETNATAGLGITFTTNDISVTDYAASAQLKTKIDAAGGVAGTTIKYTCSSNTLQQETDFSSAKGSLEFRFTYSGASNPTGFCYGGCMLQIGVW